MTLTKFAAYLAVLPTYRQACIDELLDRLGSDIRLLASRAHLDSTVQTGIHRSQYTEVPIRRFGNKAFIQVGEWTVALQAKSLILDLNPRSITAWLLLLARRAAGRRTLLWGHLHPRAGSDSRSSGLRRRMRRLANGTITYTYSQAIDARNELPNQTVWVAPNSLYRAADLDLETGDHARMSILYVGRLEQAKKVHLLVSGFAEHAARQSGTRLVIVGAGAEREALMHSAKEHGLVGRVDFLGSINDVKRLKSLYAEAFCSLSPGFAGLGLTQSLGFGVPQIVSRTETHSPEIELSETGAVHWFETDSAENLGAAIDAAFARRSRVPDRTAQSHVATKYSAEAMAEGLIAALEGRDSFSSVGA